MGRTKKKEVSSANLNQIDTYTHDDKTRANIPPVGMARYDMAENPEGKYKYDPHIDPTLNWAGKAEGTSFSVPTTSIHIHESIKPHKIIRSVQTLENNYQETWPDMFESDADRVKRRNDAIEFYQHKNRWTNRLIAGDSLIIMNSLIEKESMAGQVQMVYIDPPYGIKYGSNFQPFVNNRMVQDKKDDSLSGEPETIKAFRDTWELGIHSYLSYLRDRLLLARELLHESGSIFVQIGDENLHHVRELCDEIFGRENFFSLIQFRKSSGLASKGLIGACDYIVWYAKDISRIKYHQLFVTKEIGENTIYTWIELPDGTRRAMTREERNNPNLCPAGSKTFSSFPLFSAGYGASCDFDFEFEGRTFKCGKKSWRTNKKGIEKLIERNRIIAFGDTPRYVLYHDDFPVQTLNNLWNDTGGASDIQYVVQTATKPVQRCLLMSTDPGDLVLDITCGSGTTAYVAEQWGRRWITCDTSRVAITLAKKRLMTATYDYYKLAYPEQGVSSGFVYKRVPHITLGSIANEEPSETEVLYDQPEVEKRKVRISGPFTVEALPAPTVKPLESSEDKPAPFFQENEAKKLSDWMSELQASGILGRGGEKIEFTRVESLEGMNYLHADAETKDTRKRAVICFGSDKRPLDSRLIDAAMNEVENVRPRPAYIIFCAIQFDPAAAKLIDDTVWKGDITVLKVTMNPDLMTRDLKKKVASSQSFWLVGQPDVELIKIEEGDHIGKYKVRVKGFDYYDAKEGKLDSGGTDRIVCWMLDTDYDGMCVEPRQVFFPMEGKNEGWDKLAKTLKAEIDPELIEKYHGTESLPFEVKDNTSIAVKIVDDRAIECMRVLVVKK